MTQALQPRQPFLVSLMASLMTGLMAAVLLAGCGGAGNGQGLDANGNLLTASPPAGAASDPGGGGALPQSGNANATLDWVFDNVFNGTCKVCHTPGGAAGLNWSSKASVCAVVNNRPVRVVAPLLKEIERGDPDKSYLIWKLQGAGPNGEPIEPRTERMPLGLAPLAAGVIKNVSDWIGDGTPGC